MTSSDGEKLTKLAWKLLEAKYWYYRKSTPKLTDYQYDLLEKHKEELQNKIIEDLQGKIESLQEQIARIQRVRGVGDL